MHRITDFLQGGNRSDAFIGFIYPKNACIQRNGVHAHQIQLLLDIDQGRDRIYVLFGQFKVPFKFPVLIHLHEMDPPAVVGAQHEITVVQIGFAHRQRRKGTVAVLIVVNFHKGQGTLILLLACAEEKNKDSDNPQQIPAFHYHFLCRGTMTVANIFKDNKLNLS